MTAFVGRARESAALGTALDTAREGRASVVVVEGVAGIGKSALVRQFLDSQAPDIRILTAHGDEMEVDLEYGITEQLLGDRMSGSARGSAVDALTVGADLTVALSSDDETPILLFVDDVHWADEASLQALNFALRRTRDQPLLAVMTTRPDGMSRLPQGLLRLAEPPDGMSIRLEGFGTDELQSLAAAYGHKLSIHDTEVLREHTGGNPLYARALLSEFGESALNVGGLRGPLPAPSTFAAVIFARLMRCSPDAEKLLAAAAVLGDHIAIADAVQLAGLASAFPALDEAIEADLLEQTSTEAQDELRWPHPLVRSAIYHDLSPGRRAVLHHAAAEQLDDPRVALRHRIAGAFGPDDEVAREAEAWAVDEVRRGAWFAAEAAFLNASRLSPSATDRENRLLAAVVCAIAAGDMQRARRLHERRKDGQQTAASLYVAGALAETERRGDARELLERAWDLVDAHETPDLAVRIASQLSRHFLSSAQMDAAVQWSQRAVDINQGAPIAGEDPVTTHLRALGTVGRFDEALALARDGEGLVATREDEWPRGLIGRGTLRLWTDDIDGATADLAHVVDMTRSKGPSGSWLLALITLAEADYRAGRWGDAITHAQLALSIASDGNLTGMARSARVALAMPLAARGDRGEVESLLKPFLELGTIESSGAVALYVLGLLADAEGDHERAVRVMSPLGWVADVSALSQPGVLPWRDLYAASLIRTGDLDNARRHVASVQAQAEASGLVSARVRAARVTAMLCAADGDEAGALAAFEEAADHAERLSQPFVRADFQLAHGAALRRAGQRKAAGVQLEAALSLFQDLGAGTYASRCETELAAADLGRRQHRDADAQALTPAEQAVVHLVLAGASTKEIAGELVLSARTIETHLGRIYRKVGVRSRAQLIARLRDQPT